MTSIAAESVSTILVSCKQTRFHIETPNYRELDIEGLNITVTSGGSSEAGASSKKGKGKAARSEGTEILNNAKLRLKAGSRYALVGRNGSGKSTLLRAIAEKLIPGIPEKTRITILQQTNAADINVDDSLMNKAGGGDTEGPTVLEDVIDKATAKSELEQEINVLSEGVNNTEDPFGALRALRKVRHERMQKRLFVLDKEARLRSGMRGLQARKALVEYEKAVAESAARNEEPSDAISTETLQAEIHEAADLLAELQIQVEPSRLADIESRAKKILIGLGFTDAYMAKAASSLSGGWNMRKALATALLQETDILILDEPTNFLDLFGIIWLQRYLQSLEDLPEPPTLILVSHDRDFASLCTDLLILKDKSLTYFHGDLPTYEHSQAEKKVHLVRMREAQDKQKAHMQETIQRNMAQGRKNDDQNKIRQAKSRQKRLDDRTGMSVNARGGKFKLNRDMVGHFFSKRNEIDIPPDERSVSVVLPDPFELRFPGPLISVENLTFRYPPPKGAKKVPTAANLQPPPVLQDITFSVSMGDRVGILGLNGSGKSTLVQLLVQDETTSTPSTPFKGTITKHPRLILGYYSQHAVEALQTLAKEHDIAAAAAQQQQQKQQPPLTALSLLLEEIPSEAELNEGEIRGLLGSLGLPGRIASDVPVTKLSGGQLVRLELARILWRRPHCLVLDEVTTHLDYETVTALREALRYWAGAVVLVSHDRWFVKGAVEGMLDDAGGSEDGEDSDGLGEEEENRRRVVYRLRGGKLTVLSGGVAEFAEGVEKRVRKLLGA